MARQIFRKTIYPARTNTGCLYRARCEVMKSCRLHHYNLAGDGANEASCLEKEFAVWQGASHCLAGTSVGYAVQLALRVRDAESGDNVLTNASPPTPVPGAIHNVRAPPVLVDIDENYHIDFDNLDDKAAGSGPKLAGDTVRKFWHRLDFLDQDSQTYEYW